MFFCLPKTCLFSPLWCRSATIPSLSSHAQPGSLVVQRGVIHSRFSHHPACMCRDCSILSHHKLMLSFPDLASRPALDHWVGSLSVLQFYPHLFTFWVCLYWFLSYFFSFYGNMRKNKIQTQKGKKHGHQKWESDKETRGLGPG